MNATRPGSLCHSTVTSDPSADHWTACRDHRGGTFAPEESHDGLTRPLRDSREHPCEVGEGNGEVFVAVLSISSGVVFEMTTSCAPRLETKATVSGSMSMFFRVTTVFTNAPNSGLCATAYLIAAVTCSSCLPDR